MLAKRIIPCLDVAEGRVVKGVRLVNLRDAGDPVELAARYSGEGADELVFLDITASAEGRKTMRDVVARTAEKVFIPFTVGGGITDLETIRDLLRAGADKVSINTAAVKNPDFVGEASGRFGAQCIVVAIDARRSSSMVSGYEVVTHGGRTATGRDALEWAREAETRGAGEILLTSMDTDGTQKGYDLAMTRTIADAVAIPVIASGGAGSVDHIHEILTQGHAEAALLASLLHYGQLTIAGIKAHLKESHVEVRES